MTVTLATAFRAMNDWMEQEERRIIRRWLDQKTMTRLESHIPEPHTHGPACTCLNCAARRAFTEHRREPMALNPPVGVPIYADETMPPGVAVLRRQHQPMDDAQRRRAVASLRDQLAGRAATS